MRFLATIQRTGKTTTGIPVPDEVVGGLGSGKRPPVRVTMGGHTYRTTVASLGGEFRLSVSGEVRRLPPLTAVVGLAARRATWALWRPRPHTEFLSEQRPWSGSKAAEERNNGKRPKPPKELGVNERGPDTEEQTLGVRE